MRTIRQLELKIYGRVQGVSYRFFVQDEALKLGLAGYTRNLDDGSVEVVAQGDEDVLQKLKEVCLAGPKHAEVSGVDEKWGEADNVFQDFAIRY